MEYKEILRLIDDYTKGIDLTEEQKQSLVEAAEHVAQVALDCMGQILEALIQLISPVVEMISDELEKLCIIANANHKYNLKHDIKYAVSYYTRLYDKRTKIYRCRNNC